MKNKGAAVAVVFVIAGLLIAGCGREDEDPPHFTIGLITNNVNGLRNIGGFVDGLAELGFVDGDNVTFMTTGEPVAAASLDDELRKMVAANVDLIFTAGTPTGVAAYRITADSGIPVVFGVIADPIAAGVMTDLAHPGGNMTGVKLSESQDRRLELLLEIAPGIERLYVPYNPDDTAASTAVAQVAGLAPQLGVELVTAHARKDDEVTAMLENFPEDVDAIFLVPDSVVNARLPDIVSVADRNRLPVSGPSTAQVEEGALMTYGFVHHAAGSQAARMAAQVLNGTDPADLPVQATELYLAINLVSADSIGLEIPDAILNVAEIIVRP